MTFKLLTTVRPTQAAAIASIFASDGQNTTQEY